MPACAVCGYEAVEAFKFCPECGAAAAASGTEQRKVVTVLFCDVVGSTALGESTDPEALRALLARYFERMKQIADRHGGTVEKFIGDAIMAVFGVPAAHEDDALRACRAAVEMREALPELGVEGRIGITTGEVVTGTEERLATGDAVNVAARLQQSAQPGEVLVGGPTLQLVRGAVEVEALEPLDLKGKAQAVDASRLLAVHEPPERRRGARFVGRERELTLIREEWKRVLAEQRCELMTILGEAGVGKSRLIAEALGSVAARAVHGRCRPYGEGITYWPVIEAIKQLDGLPSDPTAASAIRSLLGEGSPGASGEEIAWAFRKLLEEQAPLVCVFDDLQWGEETFLDLVEHLALLSSGSPILLLCMARPDLVERRPAWPVAFRLEPLLGDEVEELIGERAPRELRERITRAAGGNPLFVSEMLAMAGEVDGEVAVPPTLRALLSARLDQLELAKRRVLECGAVEGEVFHRGAVQALSLDDAHVTPRLAALVRKELIRPTPAQLQREDGFRFRHLLLRDAAYEGLPKSARADFHERFAVWLEERGRDLVELDEIVGYHLEMAARYQDELGHPDPALAARAGARLSEAGRQAFARADASATSNLFRRACHLLPRDDPVRLGALRRASTGLWWSGNIDEARQLLVEQITRASELGDAAEEWSGRLDLAAGELVVGRIDADSLLAIADNAIASFDPSDDARLASAWRRHAYAQSIRGRYGHAADESERALRHARAGRERFEEGRIIDLLCTSLLYGPARVDEAIARCEAILLDAPDNAVVKANVAASLLGLFAMRGSFDAAREGARFAETVYLELGLQLAFAGLTQVTGPMEWLAGDPVAAEQELLRGLEILRPHGSAGNQEALLAEALYRQGRYADAALHANTAEQDAPPDNVLAQVGWRCVRAKLECSEPLAREAVAISGQTDALNIQGDALYDLAEVLHSAGRVEDALGELEQAIGRYEHKQNLTMASTARARLAEMSAAGAPT